MQLWKAYLDERRLEVRALAPDDPRVDAMNNTYTRALVYMHKMPRIWLDYLEWLLPQFKLTSTRRTFDKALCSLPITQHDRIWQLYLVSHMSSYCCFWVFFTVSEQSITYIELVLSKTVGLHSAISLVYSIQSIAEHRVSRNAPIAIGIDSWGLH